MPEPEIHNYRTGRALAGLAALVGRARAQNTPAPATQASKVEREANGLEQWADAAQGRRVDQPEREESNREILDALHAENYASTGRLIDRIKNPDRIDGASDVANLT